MDLSIFFDKSTYISKINSLTNLRMLTFEIWKFPILLISSYSFCIITRLPILSKIISFSFDFINFLKLYLILIAYDYFLLVIFKSYKGQLNPLERLSKLILDPNKETLVYFSNLIVIYLSANTISNSSNYIRKEHSEILKFLKMLFAFYYCNKVMIDFSIYKWPKQNLNRIDNFKKEIKKNIFSISKMNLLFIFLMTFIYLIVNFSYNDTNIPIPFFKYLFNFICSFIIFDKISNVTIGNIKCFICNNINCECNKIRSYDSLINYNMHLLSQNCFYYVHYLKNLNDLFKNDYIFKSSNYSNNSLNNILFSNNNRNFNEIKKKIDYFYNKLFNKLAFYNQQNDIYNKKKYYKNTNFFNNLMKYFNFVPAEIFENETSVYLIDLVTDLIYNSIIYFYNFIENINQQQNYQNYQMDFTLLFDILIYYEDIIHQLSESQKFHESIKLNQNLKNELSYLSKKIQCKVNYILKLNNIHPFLLAIKQDIVDRLKKFKNENNLY